MFVTGTTKFLVGVFRIKSVFHIRGRDTHLFAHGVLQNLFDLLNLERRSVFPQNSHLAVSPLGEVDVNSPAFFPAKQSHHINGNSSGIKASFASKQLCTVIFKRNQNKQNNISKLRGSPKLAIMFRYFEFPVD